MIIGSGREKPTCVAAPEEDACGRLAAHYPCGIPVCGQHLDALIEELTEQQSKPVVRTVTVNRNSSALVYYVGDPDSQTLKIGTTTNLASRFPSLREGRRRIILLAAEPGHYSLENARHNQFARWRVRGEKEWFHKAPEIMDHINELRAQFGDPWQLHASRAVPRPVRAPRKSPETVPDETGSPSDMRSKRAIPRPDLKSLHELADRVWAEKHRTAQKVRPWWERDMDTTWVNRARDVVHRAAASQPPQMIAATTGVPVELIDEVLAKWATLPRSGNRS